MKNVSVNWFEADNHGKRGKFLANFEKKDLPEIEKMDRTSPSYLSDVYQETPGHAQQKKISRKPATDNMNFGTAFHLLMEGEERFLSEYTVIPNDVGFGSTKGKESACDFLSGYGLDINPKGFKKAEFQGFLTSLDLRVVKLEWVESMVEIWNNIQKHNEIMEYLGKGHPELTIWHVDPENQVGLKGIADWLSTEKIAILDYKTTQRSIGKEAFLKHVFNENLDMKAFMYRLLLEMLVGEIDTPFGWIPIEQTGTHSVALYWADDDFMRIGKAKFEIAMAEWLRAVETKNYFTYQTDGVGEEISPAYWMSKSLGLV